MGRSWRSYRPLSPSNSSFPLTYWDRLYRVVSSCLPLFRFVRNGRFSITAYFPVLRKIGRTFP